MLMIQYEYISCEPNVIKVYLDLPLLALATQHRPRMYYMGTDIIFLTYKYNSVIFVKAKIYDEFPEVCVVRKAGR